MYENQRVITFVLELFKSLKNCFRKLKASPIGRDLVKEANCANYFIFRIKRKYFFIVALAGLLFLIISIYTFNGHFGNLNYYGIYFNQSNNITSDILSVSAYRLLCEPLLKNVKQYTVVIDGIRYPKKVPLLLNETINFECLDKSEKTKLILFYNKWFGKEKFPIDYGNRKPFKSECPVTSCETTSDKNRLNESDFVVTHMRDSIGDLPKYRPPNQRWIFLLYESPVHSGDFSKYNGFYNLTSTYRIDSNFPRYYQTYSGFIWKENKNFNENEDFSKNKFNLAVAVISNCHASSQRLEYINQMQKYVSVNVFGTCGKKCPGTYKNGSLGNCKDILGAEYKFYLAFENSMCKDYITEKFFLTLKYNTIPLVLGGGNYDFYVKKIFLKRF